MCPHGHFRAGSPAAFALLPADATGTQRAQARLRETQRNGARRRAPSVLRAIARRFELIPYGEAHERLDDRA